MNGTLDFNTDSNAEEHRDALDWIWDARQEIQPVAWCEYDMEILRDGGAELNHLESALK